MTDPRTRPSIAVVVLNWNGASDTLECLASLRESVVRVHAIVVDNGSLGSDVEQIRVSKLADTLIEAHTNLGYAEGNNVGIRFAMRHGFSIVGVLNNDTIVAPDSVGTLAYHLMEQEQRVVSPDIRYYDDPARSWFRGGVLDKGWPRHLQSWEFRPGDDRLQPTDCLSGCCMLARTTTWARVGLFDPAYFLIFEDSDWSVRATRCGVRLYVVGESTIMHKVSRSMTGGASALLAAFYYVRNGLTFEATYSRQHLLAFALRWLIRPSLSSITHRRGGSAILFRWLGALAFLIRCHGRAPAIVERLASRLAGKESPVAKQ